MTETADPSGRRLPRLCSRLALHVVVLAVIIWLVVLAVSKAPGRASASIDPGIAMSDTRAVEAPLSARGGSSLSGYAALSVDVMPAIMPAYDVPAPVAPTGTLPLALDGNLFKLPSPQTIIPKRPRKELITYAVQKGDTLEDIAKQFEVDVDTLIWANADLEMDPDFLLIDQKVTVPPVSGVLYKVKEGDTLEAIAKKYKGDVAKIKELEYNNLQSPTGVIIADTLLMVPGGEKPYQPRTVNIGGQTVTVNAPRGVGKFQWPASGYISQYFGDYGHRGLDIAGPSGSPVYAADAGVVIESAWDGGFGNCIMIDHGNGFVTLYAHLTTFYTQVGQNIRAGQAIGKTGSTGNSTGPHLHFEVQYMGGLTNPLKYLPQ